MTGIQLLLAALLISFSAQEIVPCWVVKRAVTQYGEAAVESWARSKGVAEKQIEKARQCLK
jgi:hypothetical protein